MRVFIGLVLFSAGLGWYCNSEPLGWMVFGLGLFICGVVDYCLKYLDGKR